MANGYTGKIARINLTTNEITTIDTAKYEEFGGGYGIGAAIFWDLAVAPGQWDLKGSLRPQSRSSDNGRTVGRNRRSRGRQDEHMRHLSGDVPHV